MSEELCNCIVRSCNNIINATNENGELRNAVLREEVRKAICILKAGKPQSTDNAPPEIGRTTDRKINHDNYLSTDVEYKTMAEGLDSDLDIASSKERKF